MGRDCSWCLNGNAQGRSSVGDRWEMRGGLGARIPRAVHPSRGLSVFGWPPNSEKGLSGPNSLEIQSRQFLSAGRSAGVSGSQRSQPLGPPEGGGACTWLNFGPERNVARGRALCSKLMGLSKDSPFGSSDPFQGPDPGFAGLKVSDQRKRTCGGPHLRA